MQDKTHSARGLLARLFENGFETSVRYGYKQIAGGIHRASTYQIVFEESTHPGMEELEDSVPSLCKSQVSRFKSQVSKTTSLKSHFPGIS